MQRDKGVHQDGLGLQGRVEILAYRGKELFYREELKNLILYRGNAEVVRTLSMISPSTAPRIINRMAVGDQGTIPADPTEAKLVTAKDKSLSGLFHEVYRKDIEARVLTLEGARNECKFITTFYATDVPISAFSNPSQPRINEVGLVLIDPVASVGLTRDPVAAPTLLEADEVLMSIRTFKSIPFEAENDVSVTIRYTIFME